MDFKQKNEEILDAFERYADRRIQRFPFRSPNATRYRGLGWMKIVSFIKGKKLLFLRTVICQPDYIPCREILRKLIPLFEENMVVENVYDSPLINILNIAVELELIQTVKRMETVVSSIVKLHGVRWYGGRSGPMKIVCGKKRSIPQKV